MRIGTWLAIAGGLVLSCAAQTACPQRLEGDAAPISRAVGPTGKEVIWADVSDAAIRAMLEIANVGTRDYVVDLGSANGRPVIVAARDFGARSLGIAYEPKTVEALRKVAVAAGVAAKAQFRRADVFASEFALDFASATVVTVCLLPEVFPKIRQQILDMKPGTRVVSASASFGDWSPDAERQTETGAAYLWTVPARIDGAWILQQPGTTLEIVWTQHFQKVRALARVAGTQLQVVDATLQGDRIEFVVVFPEGSRGNYSGRISGRQMLGTLASANLEPVKWSATRR